MTTAAATTLNPKQLKYWLALWRTPEIGPIRFGKLLLAFPDLEELFTLPKSQLASLNIPSQILAALQNPNWTAIERDLRWSELPNHHIISLQDAIYPPLLKEISSAPPLLFIHGCPDILTSPQLAMVGSRNPTPMGKETALNFAGYLTQAGLTITSGLALGIDGKSHEGAIAGAGKTIAVLGSGIDCIYPKRHGNLAERILAAQGAIISELPTGISPQAEHFPRRNRIVSGLSLGVLVIEATRQSGSLITAHLAGEQGREVFAIPGSIHNPLSRGCHFLIQRGAKLVTTVQDILEELPHFKLSEKAPLTPENPGGKARTAMGSKPASKKLLAEDYQQLLECIGFEATSIDQMVARSGQPPHTIASMLITLELKGYISAVVAGGYTRLS